MTPPFPRQADHDIMPLLIERWSPRAFAPVSLSDAELNSLFEAARWSPSAFNTQPWRFVYARRDTAHWEPFLDLVMPFNRVWVQNASVLVFVLSSRFNTPAGKTEPEPLTHASFDTGAAWACLALQAQSMGLITHAMAGIEADRIPVALNIPEGYKVEIAVAIGRKGDPALLSEKLQGREVPSQRRPVAESAFEGSFPR